MTKALLAAHLKQNFGRIKGAKILGRVMARLIALPRNQEMSEDEFMRIVDEESAKEVPAR